MSWRVPLALLSSLLFISAFPPLGLGALAWVTLVPLLLAIEGLAPLQAFRLGYLAGFLAFVSVLAWLRVFGLAAWMLLAAYLALYVGAFCGLYRWAAEGRSSTVRIWLVPILWVALEYVRSVGPTGFPWATLATTQSAYLPVVQVATVAGIFGISFVVALGNAIVAGLARRRLLPALAPALLVVAVLGWGAHHLKPIGPSPLTAVALQPNVPQREKFAPTFMARNMAILDRLIHEAASYHPDLIVFPESAVPRDLFGEGGALERVGAWAREVRATLLASSLEGGVSNIAISVAPSGFPLSRYDKVRLVAFGEAGVRPGTRHDPLETPAGPVGVVICFESIFPDVTRELARNGAEVLAIITNDAWFDGTSGPAQHAAHAILRAVETGRWVIRATNTGISMIVDPQGRITARAPAQQQTLLEGRLARSDVTTFYARWGDLFAYLVLVGAVMLVAPRLWTTLAPEWRRPLFHQVGVTVALPFVAIWSILQRGNVAAFWPLFLLVFLAVFAGIRPVLTWGVRRNWSAWSAGAGLAVVLGLWALLALNYRAEAVPITWTLLRPGWVENIARQIGIAFLLEGWLRGIAFTSLAEWKGWPTAVIGTTLLSAFLQTGLAAEAFVWAALTGAVFGLIRARSGDASGLVIPHALGNLLMGVLLPVR